MNKSFNKLSIFFVLIFFICLFLFKQKHKFIYTYPLQHSCKAVILNKNNSNKVYVSLKFKNTGVLRNSNTNHGISALISKLLFNKIGNLSPEETQEKLNQLGVLDISVTGTSNHIIISFCIVENQFKPAIEFIVSGLTYNFSETDLLFSKEFFPVPIYPEISSPYSLLSDKLYQNLYPNHIYGKNTTGSAEAISQVTLSNIKEFIKNNLALSNLIIYYSGKSAKTNVNILFEALAKILPHETNNKDINTVNDFSKITITKFEDKILNKNIKDICGIMTGIRFDNLSLQEKSALFIISNALFSSIDGQFLDNNKFAVNFSYKIEDRTDSTILILTAFVNKKDLNKYQIKLKDLFENIELSNIKNIDLSKEFFIKKQAQEKFTVQSIYHSLSLLTLPFKDCSSTQFQQIIQKLKQPEFRTTVVLTSEQ